MRHDYQAPVVATVEFPGHGGVPGTTTVKTVHLTIGPAGHDPASQETVLWAWSASARDGYAWYRTPNEPVPQGGSQTRWTLDLGDGVTAKLRVRANAWCCGDPFKRWRPPGFDRPVRRSAR